MTDQGAAVDLTKHTVPIWKEEFYADGSSAFVTGCCIGDAQDPAEANHGHAHDGVAHHTRRLEEC